MHFIRCVLPNNHKQQGQFDEESVLRQLRTSCIVPYAKFIRFGYSKRISFQELSNKCKILEDKFVKDFPNRKHFYSKVLLSIGFGREEFKMGSDMIFFRSNKFGLLKTFLSDMTTVPHATTKPK